MSGVFLLQNIADKEKKNKLKMLGSNSLRIDLPLVDGWILKPCARVMQCLMLYTVSDVNAMFGI